MVTMVYCCILSLITLFSNIFVACPLCVGMPKVGLRPYVERLGIQYIVSAHTNVPLSAFPKKEHRVPIEHAQETTKSSKDNSVVDK
jgi:hypothetical protein